MSDSDYTEIDFTSGMSAFEGKHFPQAINLLLPYAEKGNPDAQHRLAIMYQNGLGVAVNQVFAEKWMRAAAENGLGIAQHGLGFMYMEGDCVDKDLTKAVEWFTHAAEQGLAGSCTTLAMMYEQGDGIEKDLDKAREWYAKAGFEDHIPE
jgi:TPR repeat protein